MVSAKVGVISKREYLGILLQFSTLMQKPTQLHWNSFDGLNIFVYYPSVFSNVVFLPNSETDSFETRAL